jgi:hypothetical protein
MRFEVDLEGVPSGREVLQIFVHGISLWPPLGFFYK